VSAGDVEIVSKEEEGEGEGRRRKGYSWLTQSRSELRGGLPDLRHLGT